EQQWIEHPRRQSEPIPGALTVYTDAGKKTRTAAITWQKKNQWEHQLIAAEPMDTLQTLELVAVVRALMLFKEPLNVVTDSLYVAGIASRIEDAYIKETKNRRLYELLL
ncbi:POK6 protein, partial [Mohoua ochrocephala]|nr:POK6 protein [Mohoua ochrocephala]